jgi:molybdenum cofactor cytidylyltransferase
VVVVLGAHATLIEPVINRDDCMIMHNTGWQEGIASSIRMGITAIDKNFPFCDGVLVMVCDQPYITPDILLEIAEVQEKSGKPMAACSYEGITGTPALFHRSIFTRLLSLEGDKGAGKLLNTHLPDVATVTFAPGKFDIDTKEDYAEYLKRMG